MFFAMVPARTGQQQSVVDGVLVASLWKNPWVRRQIVRDTNARSCADAWRITAASLAGTLTRAQQDALTSYGIDPASASISGTTAEARFEPVPEALRRVLDAPPAPLRFRRVGRDWKIDSVPL